MGLQEFKITCDKHALPMKNKKPLYIALLSLDAVLTIGLAIFNLVMMINTIGKSAAELLGGEGLIGYLQQNPTVYLLAFVLPLFLLLAGNIIGLVLYVRKSTAKEQQRQVKSIDDLTPEELAAIKAELNKDVEKKEE